MKEHMTEEQFVDRVRSIAREEAQEANADEGKADKIADEVERQLKEWSEKTSSQREEALKGLREDLANEKSPKDKTGRNAGIFGKNLSGPGSDFAKSVPFLTAADEKYNDVSAEKVKSLAKNGVGEHGYTSKEVEQAYEKFLNAGNVDAGAGFIPEPLAQDFIEFLYTTTAVRRAGAQTIEMPNGTIKVPKQTGSTTGHWIGEGEGPDGSEPTFEMHRMEAKKLAIMVVLSNDLVRQSPRGIEQLVLSDMRQRAVIEEDSGMLFGDGQSGKLTGIYDQMPDAQKFEREAASIDSIIRDLNKAIYKVEKENVAPQTPGWILHPRTVRYLMTLRGSDSFLFAPQLVNGSLLGAPVHPTTQVPRTLDDSGDATNDETRIIYGDFSQALIGETLNLRSVSSQEATVDVGGGTLRHLLQQDMRAMVLFHEVDFMLRRPEAFSAINGVDWGSQLDA